MKRFLLLIFILLTASAVSVEAQNNATVLNPNDVVNFLDVSAPLPAVPANNNTIYKWYATKKVSWNTTNYKAYIFNGLNFRLRFPKNYNPADTSKKYPLILMLHGKGEVGDVYENDLQLVNGGQIHDNAVINGQFDGFLLFPESTGPWGSYYFDRINQLINIMADNAHVDLNRIVVHGLSYGGAGTNGIIASYPKLFAAALPMSPVGGWSNFSQTAYIPMWVSQGGLDINPDPGYTTLMVNQLRDLGANVIFTIYPELGHGVWNSTYSNPDFFPYINRAHKANPLVFFGRTEFCPGDVVSVKLGLSPGFDGYQWRKDGTIIAGATNNTYQATQFGTYEARFKRGTVWSPWSPTPVVIKLKSATIPPTITVKGINSSVLPAGNGTNNVTLEVPIGYAQYQWHKSGSTAVLSTTNELLVSQPGDYVVQITELYGCSSNDSQPFNVISANGNNKPDAVTNFSAQASSKTAVSLSWKDVLNPQNNETAFEIYRSLTANSGFTMIAKVPADSLKYIDEGLSANTKYYYTIRSINLNGASAISQAINATTLTDDVPPTSPGNLRITGVSKSFIDITWEQSSDDIGVEWYDIYLNGQKFYSTEADNNSFRIGSLNDGVTYTVKVLAKDFSGNLSAPSNQVTVKTASNGFNYKYYEGLWTSLPNFNLLTPIASGITDDIDLSVKQRTTNFGVVYEGFITIPVTGNYTFETYSDDGSKMYIGNYDPTATALVNNDGAHGLQYREGTVYLTQGAHPITVTYIQAGGGYDLKLFWKNTANGVVSRQQIPKSFFTDNQAPLVKPAMVSNVNAVATDYDKIKVTWTDHSSDETGFEIYRAKDILGPYVFAHKAEANTVSYTDVNLSPETNYFYKIKTISNAGESDFSGIFQELKLNFNNSFNDESSFDRNATGYNGAAFSTVKKEGSHALSLDGVNDYVNIGNTTTGGFLNTAFDARTISFWFNPQLLTQNRTLLDIGSSSNGISLRTNLTNLELGIASNNVRRTLSTSIALNTWYLITVVYDANSLKFYKDGVLVDAATDLTFTSILATTDGSRLGYRNGSNAFNYNTNYYAKGLIDAFIIYNGALSSDEIQSLYSLNPIDAKAKTIALPAAPIKPAQVVATSLSSKSIRINWAIDSLSYGPLKYALYRSTSDSSNFVKFFDGELTSGKLTDSSLVAHQTYYYKLKSSNVGGESSFSSTVSAITKNTKPLIATLADKIIRYDQPSSLDLTALDADGDSVHFSLAQNVDFIALTSVSANSARLNFNPSEASVGIHYLKVIGQDDFGGIDTMSFKLTVNQNYTPSLAVDTSVYALNENTTGEIGLTGNDLNTADSLNFTLNYQTPGFVNLVKTGDRTAKLVFSPSYADAGVYHFFVKVNDQNSAIDSTAITLTVNDVNPGYRIYVNFANNSSQGGYWNNVNSPVNGKVFSRFINEQLDSTNVGLVVTSDWQNWWNNSGNNGVYSNALYPIDVTNTSWALNNSSQTFKLTGLSSSLKYDLSFLSSKYNDNSYYTTISSDTDTVSINPSNNTTDLVTLPSLRPNSEGELTVTISSQVNANAVINALLITASIPSVDVPSSPRDLTATYQDETKKVKLSWTDAAFDETGYDIYRAVGSGDYVFYHHLSANSVEYLDSAFVGNAQLSYKVKAVNELGGSAFSNAAQITTPNKIPTLSAIANQELKAGKAVELTIQANDDIADVLTITGTNLPSFATLSTISNGLSKLILNPTLLNVGDYKGITIQTADNHGGLVEVNFDINVKDSNDVSIKINFNQYNSQAYPWNNTNASPSAGLTLSDLKDTNGAGTGLGLQLLSAWSGANNLGMNTGNNSAAYPDNVMSTFYYDLSGDSKEIKITGLEASKTYSFKFFASWQNPWAYGITKYMIGTDTVVLDPANNLTNTVQINNVMGDQNGQAIIKVERQSGSTFIFIGSLIINSYLYTGNPITPSDLTAIGVSKNSINLKWKDNSNNEDGFEIYRASSENGAYALVYTTPASTSSYTDQALIPNTIYWYKVRAVRTDGKNSNYSNLVSASTLSYFLSINFNRDDPAPSPWNNTNKNPENGDRFNNLKDDNGVSTSISLTMIDNFTGANNLGVVTGSNSGKYPDVVNKWFYYSEKNETARIKLSGLNQTMAYDFEFFGSWYNPFANGNTSYTINGAKVLLDPANNTTKTVFLSNIIPDGNGEIFIDIFMQPEAQYAFINALIVKAHAKLPTNGNAMLVKNNTLNVLDLDGSSGGKVTVYPNPFYDHIDLKLDNINQDSKKLKLQLTDINGRVLKVKDYALNGGYLKNFTLPVDDLDLKSGIYLLHVIIDGNKGDMIKIIKL